jgi:2-iminobutanoate/2-iminopropanoate deaminase
MMASSSLRSASAALCAPLLATSGTALAGDVEYYRSNAAIELNFPFSDAVTVGDFLFLSGELGNRPGTPELVAGGMAAEARQAMDNIGAVLKANGSSFDKIIKCTIMLADIADWPAFNEVYVSYFESPYPARSAFAAAGLALNARVEVECIARR